MLSAASHVGVRVAGGLEPSVELTRLPRRDDVFVAVGGRIISGEPRSARTAQRH